MSESESEPKMILEPTGITEDAIRRASGTRRSVAEWEEEPTDRNDFTDMPPSMPPVLPEGMNLQEQREYLEDGLANLNHLRAALKSPQAVNGAKLAREAVGKNVDKLSESMKDPAFRQGMREMAGKFSEMREAADLATERLTQAAPHLPRAGHAGMVPLSNRGPGTGARGHVKGGDGGAKAIETVAQRAAKARARNATKAARAMRKKNRRK